MPCSKILEGLSAEQRGAATAARNAVVAAGAGSGKTKTLAARYAWLVMEKGLKTDEILTLTFTNKAANEMYDRIYRLLQDEKDDPRAREAVKDFYKARISTLDSFCAGIVRTASRRYGLAPDFVIDDRGVREAAREAALPFVLENRENPALKTLLANRSAADLARELFAEAALFYGLVPPEEGFAAFMRNQDDKILGDWRIKTRQAETCVNGILRELAEHDKTQNAATLELRGILGQVPPVPQEENTNIREQFRAYFDFLYRLKNVNLNEGAKGKDFAELRAYRKELKDTLYGELEALANSILQREVTAGLFSLLEKFLEEENARRRQAGALSFTDLPRLAVDALKRYPDIRKVYKDAIKAIMIDEFQDNNALQRDLIFLLAEKPERMGEGVPLPEELEEGKMFFVGDEKQSIYRFRGADVAVFRSLARTLGNTLNLSSNYRSGPGLIDAFNRVFGGCSESPGAATRAPVFLAGSAGLPDFEAAYTPMRWPAGKPPPAIPGPPISFAFLDRGRLKEDELSAAELEAAFIVMRIKQMKESGFTVYRSGEICECDWSDFAVLQRRYTHQRYLEKYCKDFGVPFVTDRPEGLFTDAPINDLVMLLRLIAYPEDRLAYAAILRSPFARLGDESLAVCMLDTDSPPFCEEFAANLGEEDRPAYLRAARRYAALAQQAKTLSLPQLVSRIWYGEGLRYETMWPAAAQSYAGLFDVFYKIAQEARGKTLAGFIDYIEELIAKEEKLDDTEVPGEEDEGVKIMSIHKSKGLEFPVVFIYDGAYGGRADRNDEPVYFHEKWGLTINLPLAEELPEKGRSYFYLLQQEEEKQKNQAELRRLLYVAMTRSESCVYFTASLPEQNKEEKKKLDLSGEDYNEDLIKKRLLQIKEREDKNLEKGEEKNPTSFLDLLLPALTEEEEYFTIQAIPILSRKDIAHKAGETRAPQARSFAEAALAAAALYAAAPALAPSRDPPTVIPASKLRKYTQPELDFDAVPAAGHPANTPTLDSLDAVLEKAGIEAVDFGTIVHSFLEAGVAGRPPLIPARILARLDDKNAGEIRAAAEKMARGFLDSDLGKLSLAASLREAEFSVISGVVVGSRNIAIAGKIDLLFEAGGYIHVVDFKTDSEEDPARHLGQLAVYARAAGDIFGKPVRAWLFYLRRGRALELTGDIEGISIEGMVTNYCSFT